MKIGGKELRITLANFQTGIDLQRAFGQSLIEGKLNLEGISLNKEDVLKTDISGNSLSSIISTLISIGISEKFESCIFECAKSCLWGNDKVDRDLFEKVENREFYYPIMIEIAIVNLSPFAKGLLSMFTGAKEKFTNILKSK
jgi:hypothetical protein